MITSLDQLDLTKKYTYADYITWQFDDMVELIKGFIVKMSPAPRRNHQLVSANIFGEFYIHFKSKKCQVYEAPFDVRLMKNKNNNFKEIETVVQPDICIICDLEKLDEMGCVGSPDLIVEIVSKSSKKRDYHDKYDLYEENGVKEYWIVDPDAKSIDTFYLENDKYIQTGNYYNMIDVIKSSIFPEFILELKDVFEE
jgi:Uma2 family endonuclease